MNMLYNTMDYFYGYVNKDKADSLTAQSSEVTIEDNWRGNIRAGAFEGNTNLVLLNTKDITGIEDGAFKGCEHLKTLILPNIEQIGENVFENCTELCEVDVKNDDMAEIVIKKLIECGLKQRIDMYIAEKFKISIKNNYACLFNDKIKKIATGREFVVPQYYFTGALENIIPAGAFSYIENLIKIDTNAATIVQNYAFLSCSNLREIYLLNLKEIANLAFAKCNNLSDVYVREEMVDRVKEVLKESELRQQVYIHVNDEIVDALLDNLSTTEKLTYTYDSATIPAFYKKIDDNTLYNISTVKIDTNQVTVMGRDVLRKCTSLKEIYLPNVEKIGDNFCRGCRNLEKITVKDEPMASTIKGMFDSYDEFRSVDLNIYIYGNDEPFAKIEKNDKEASLFNYMRNYGEY